jgi:acetyltransferase-like isoleucine patch superfamily enzyme/acyl carrier protein
MTWLGAAWPQVRHRRRDTRLRSQRRRSSLFAALSLRACDRVGEGAAVRGRPFIENVGRIEIGEEFCLNSEPVQSHLVTGHTGHLTIGDNVSIGFGAAIAAHTQIVIGNRVRIGPYAMIMDTDFHDVVDRDALPEGGTIHIGDDVRVGSRVTILKGSVIGAGTWIEAGSVVTGKIPAGVRASGVPARVLDAAGVPTRREGAAAAANDNAINEGTLPEQVRRVVASTFALESPPELSSGPDSIPAWDSLGTLTLLLAIEDEFQVALSEEEMLDAKNVQDLIDSISCARGRALSAGESPCMLP